MSYRQLSNDRTVMADVLRDLDQRVSTIEDAGFGLLPPGCILHTGAQIAPAGFLLCDGSAVSRKRYAALFAVLGLAYGAGDGTTTFNLPDLRGRAVYGVGGTTPDTATRGSNDGFAVTARSPKHRHAGTGNTYTSGNTVGALTAAIGPVASDPTTLGYFFGNATNPFDGSTFASITNGTNGWIIRATQVTGTAAWSGAVNVYGYTSVEQPAYLAATPIIKT